MGRRREREKRIEDCRLTIFEGCFEDDYIIKIKPSRNRQFEWFRRNVVELKLYREPLFWKLFYNHKFSILFLEIKTSVFLSKNHSNWRKLVCSKLGREKRRLGDFLPQRGKVLRKVRKD